MLSLGEHETSFITPINVDVANIFELRILRKTFPYKMNFLTNLFFDDLYVFSCFAGCSAIN